MKLRIAVGADHGGFELKSTLISRLRYEYEIIDCGATIYDANDDYPDFAEAVAKAIASGKADRGVLICGSGVGACIAANKFPGIRASLCHDIYSSRQGVEHDDMNVLCLGARVIGAELAMTLMMAFLNAQFSKEEKYHRRLDKVLSIEKRTMNKTV
jgi:ribose 5-phosphate isomerase B